MSCELHLDFERKIRYNNYVICKIEYAGVSEWQTQTTQNRSGNHVGSSPTIGTSS